MADDDDWETDADFENTLTEAEQRAFGNRETMEKYNTVMDKAGGSVPGQSKVPLTAPAPPAKVGSIDLSDPGVFGGAPAAATCTSSKAPQATAPAAAPPAAATPPKPVPNKLQIPAMLERVPEASVAEPAAASPRSAAQVGASGKHGAVHTRQRGVSAAGEKELRELFDSFDLNRDNTIDVTELHMAMDRLGIATTAEQVAAIVKEVDLDNSGKISFSEFARVVEQVKSAGGGAGAHLFEEVITKQRGAVMQDKHDNTVHSFSHEECTALVDFINSKLAHYPVLSYLLPMREITGLFSACADGVLLCHLINVAASDTIDERVINIKPPNKFLIAENLNLALSTAKSLGIKVVNIGSSDILEGRPHLVLGLVWQIVKVALLSKINLKENPNLIRLLQEDETLESLLKLPPEKLLLRWFNFHLTEAGVGQQVSNFGKDLADSSNYVHLLSRIDPEKKASAAILSQTTDRVQRAKEVCKHGQRVGAEFKVTPEDIASGNEKLNLGFVAALFNACPGLLPPDAEAFKLLDELPEENEGDSREERAFRMWINSLGLDTHVANLFDDVRDGWCILLTMDQVRPGVVQWSKVNKPPLKMVFKKLENLNYAVSLGKGPFAFSLVGVDGKDLSDGNKKLTLALVWQLMRCHLVAFLASVRRQGSGSDEEMIQWANERVAASGASTTMRDFQDKSLSNCLFLIDLLAAVEPRAVDHKLVTQGATDEEKRLNAKYAISSARKLGCSLFCTYEDLVDVKPKMILSFVATLMSFALAGKPATPRSAAVAIG